MRANVCKITVMSCRYTAADAARLATVTLDLMAALCAHHLEAGASLPPEIHQQTMQAQIHDFVRKRLGDPELSPDTTAVAHQISTRYLYKLFQDQGLTVAGWIRQRRLERCRRDLADPKLHPYPIYAIAARWGFTDRAHFSRAFRAAHGMTAKDYRHLAHHGHGLRGRTATAREQSGTS